MSDSVLARMSTGFELCGIAIFVWASIDYNRFIKFWMLRPAPYTQRVRIIFRVFFLACLVGGMWQVAETIAASPRPAMAVLSALPFAAAWLVVVFLILYFVEWMNRRFRIKQSHVRQP